MPIKVPNNLPAIETLTNENVFVMTDTRAMTQDMRPLHILLLNLIKLRVCSVTLRFRLSLSYFRRQLTSHTLLRRSICLRFTRLLTISKTNIMME